MSLFFDRDNCSSSVYLHLQVTSLMLLRTTCSFHGSDSRYVWALWADFEQAIVDKPIGQWRKRFWAFMKTTCYDLLLDALFQTIFKWFSYFNQYSVLRMIMIDSISMPIVILCLLVVCYTLVMCSFSITSLTNETYSLRVQKHNASEAVFMMLCHKVTGSVFWLSVYKM